MALDPRYKWRQEHPEAHAAGKHAAYVKKKKYYKEQDAQRYRLIRMQLFAILGCKCVKCGFSDIRALQLDHKEGGGNAEQRELKSARNMYVFYLNRPELARQRLQMLCANCNWLKKAERNESPVKQLVQQLPPQVLNNYGKHTNIVKVMLWSCEKSSFLDGFRSQRLN